MGKNEATASSVNASIGILMKTSFEGKMCGQNSEEG